MLAGLAGASVSGRIALGGRAGAPVRRLGRLPEVWAAGSRGPRQPQLEGFDLHANMWVPARDRASLDRPYRYLHGRVLLELRKAWRDGTSQDPPGVGSYGRGPAGSLAFRVTASVSPKLGQ